MLFYYHNAVSYTHLDVYKRQCLLFVELIRIALSIYDSLINNFQVMIKSQIHIGKSLRLHALRCIDNEDRSFAG